MALPVEINPLQLKTSGGYSVGKSLRFRSSASAYLNRTPATSTNQKTWTWSGWFKRSKIGVETDIFSAFVDGSNFLAIAVLSNDQLGIVQYTSGSGVFGNQTNAVLRDPSAWYHVVVTFDTTQTTAANRIVIYINGVAQTTNQRSGYAAQYPTQNSNGYINQNLVHNIGFLSGGVYFDGYMAEVNFIDGQALTASSFGAYDTNGVWQPIKYSGSYGTNGFYLNFGNTTSTTTLGYDTSGNGNNWTPNNISLTTGTTYDSMTDSPTVTSSSVANYAVLNPLVASTGTISDGNLGLSTTTTNATSSTFYPSTGKWYWEAVSTSGTASNTRFGIVNRNGAGADLGGSANGWAYLGDGRVYNNGSTSSYGVTYSTNDIMMLALDLDAGKLWYGKNGTWMASGSPSTGANPSQTFTANQQMSPALASGTGTIVYAFNAGQRPFTYTPPTGFNALNTYNLPTPTISNGAQYMAATTYTGNGSTQSIANTVNGKSFQPDLVWVKSRSATSDHKLTDSVRGTTLALSSDLTSAEATDSGGLTAFNSNGFSVGSGSNYNTNAATQIAWQWKASGSTASNTNGSITSTVSANTTAGFSVVTYTGTGASMSFGHGLNVAPAMVVFKSRNTAATNWLVYHQNYTSTNYYQYLNSTIAQTNNGSTLWTIGNSTIAIPNSYNDYNGSGLTYVAYCWAAVAGYSAFGSYTGNGSTDGPFVYCGFRPRWVMIKRTDTTDNWIIVDTSRDTYNAAGTQLLANSSNADTANSADEDILSNGFKLRTSGVGRNASGGTYIYAAFAENPFQSSRAR
jgi:Concanavalin A-like lectin/glucanases superfamily/SPRY domain